MTMLVFTDSDGGTMLEVAADQPLPVYTDAPVVRVTDEATQVVVSTSVPTLIARANPKRVRLILTNLTGSQICHLRNDSMVSATTSRAILTAAVGNTFTTTAQDAIYGLSISATQTVLVWEEEIVT